MQHDEAYKALFGYPRLVADLVRLVAGLLDDDGPALLDAIDLDTLEKLPHEYVTEDLRRRLGDSVWRVRRRGAETDDPGQWLHLLVMLEFQSEVDGLMALRVRHYADLLYLDLHRRTPFGRGQRLPPVLPVVLYNGRVAWWAPERMGALVAGALGGEEAAGAGRSFTGEAYVAVDFGGLVVEDLPGGNAATLLAGLENAREAGDVLAWVEQLYAWLGGPQWRALREVFLEWAKRLAARDGHELGWLAEFEEREMAQLHEAGELRPTLGERVRQWAEHYRAEGIERGRAEGIERGIEQGIEQERALLRRQVARKLGASTAERLAPLLARVEDPEHLAEVGEWIIDCDDGAELLRRVRRLSAS